MKYIIEQDTFRDESPRDWDNACTMACWHRRYILGDVQPTCSPSEFLVSLADDAVGFKCDTDELPQHHIQAVLDKYYYIGNLYLYDHSGITISLHPFSCPWDSGQVGIIFMPKSVAKEESGGKEGKELDAWAERMMESEVNAYDQYLTGDIWCVAVVDDDGNALDSCCGFYGHDYAEQQAKEMLEHCKKNSFDPAI